jgi:divalent metal cation (Fe/Co/Zn/Cd) transporter
VNHTTGIHDVKDVRVRWSGHWLLAEVSVAVSPELSVEKGHEIAKEVRHQLLHHLRYLYNATIHIDPVTAPGDDYHGFDEHAHGSLPAHSHR